MAIANEMVVVRVQEVNECYETRVRVYIPKHRGKTCPNLLPLLWGNSDE